MSGELEKALRERPHEALIQDYIDLMAKVYRLECKLTAMSSPISEAEWNGPYTGMGMRSRETVNDILKRREG